MNQYITGAVIKELREKNNMTQAELAQRLCVSDKAVSKWETGKGYPDISLLDPIAGVFGISITELISGSAIYNTNVSGNMLRSKFYVCPICGNVVHSIGELSISCHGVTLLPSEAEPVDELHKLSIEQVEDEYYISLEHEMTKEHYISFIAALTPDGMLMKKLYPEGACEARFKRSCIKQIYFYCNKDGLYMANILEYQKQAKKQWGNTAEYKEFEKKTAGQSDAQKQAIGDGLMKIFAQFGQMKELPVDADRVQEQVGKLRDYISENYYQCSNEILQSLGIMYAAGGEFTENIDKAGGKGTAEFAAEAIRIFCEG